jgi:hypothetical protein
MMDWLLRWVSGGGLLSDIRLDALTWMTSHLIAASIHGLFLLLYVIIWYLQACCILLLRAATPVAVPAPLLTGPARTCARRRVARHLPGNRKSAKFKAAAEQLRISQLCPQYPVTVKVLSAKSTLLVLFVVLVLLTLLPVSLTLPPFLPSSVLLTAAWLKDSALIPRISHCNNAYSSYAGQNHWNIIDTMPHSDEPPEMLPAYTKDPVNGWIHGGHPDMTPEKTQNMQDMLLDHKDCFAYSLNELSGYTGPEGPFEIKLSPNAKIITPQRRHPEIERSIQDEKCKPLLDAGIIIPCVDYTQYASETTF